MAVIYESATSASYDRLQPWFDRVEQVWGTYKHSPWQLGDLIEEGLAEFTDGSHEKVEWLLDLLADQLEVSPKTLSNYARVSRAFPDSERWGNLEMSHHEAVIKLAPDERQDWLRQAAEGQWTVNRLRMEMRDKEEESLPPSLGDDEVTHWLWTEDISVDVEDKRVVFYLNHNNLVASSRSKITWRLEEETHGRQNQPTD